MIPILSSIIVKASKNENMSATKGFILSLIYVLSISIAYTIAGIIAGLFGASSTKIIAKATIT
jgi:thiol:disulfide interchange protein DsbD